MRLRGAAASALGSQPGRLSKRSGFPEAGADLAIPKRCFYPCGIGHRQAKSLKEEPFVFLGAYFDLLLADEYWLRGQAALALEQYDTARESLLKPKEAAEAQEEHAVLWKILATLGEVEKASGHADLAEKLRDQARQAVNDIATHAGEVRDVFLSQPTVVRLLGEN